MLPSGSMLWDYYLTGLSRNIHSILAGVYGGHLEVPDSNRSRGERSVDVLRHLIQHEDLPRVLRRLLSPESKNSKQGKASLHDLALGHVLLCTAICYRHDTLPRAASVIASSMLLGEAIENIRQGYLLLDKAFPNHMPTDFSDAELRSALGATYLRIEQSIADAASREVRSNQISELAPTLTVGFLLSVFWWMTENGLDDRPFEGFVAGMAQ